MKLTTPAEQTLVTISLPGETLRATVARVVNPNLLVVELTAAPMAKSHSYRFGDFVPCRREVTELGGLNSWVAYRPPPSLREAEKVAAEIAPMPEAPRAPKRRIKPKNNLKKRSRDDGRRVSTKAGGRGKSQQRPKASLKKSRRGAGRV